MEAGQKAADLYINTLKKNAETEYKALMKEIEESRQRIKHAEEQQIKKISEMTQFPEKTEDDAVKAPKKRTRKKKDE